MKKLILFTLLFITVASLTASISDPFADVEYKGGGTTIVSRVTITIGGVTIAASTNDRVAAIVDNKIRANVNLEALKDAIGVGRTFLVQTTDATETLRFQLWRYSTQQIYHTEVTLQSKPGDSYGSVVNFVNLNFTIPTLTVSGGVFFNSETNPLGGIKINIQECDPHYINMYRTLTTGNDPLKPNEKGLYAIPNLTSGTKISFFASDTDGLYYFNPTNYSYPVLTASPTANFFAGANPTYTVSGYVRYGALGVPDVSIHNTKTNEVGFYSFQLVQNGSTVLIPSKPGWTFSPASSPINFISANMQRDFTATPQLFTIQGNTGIAYARIDYSGTTSGSSYVNSDSQGNYTIYNVAYGDNVTIIPSKDGTIFSPISRIVSNITSHVTNINFTASPVKFIISGVIKEGGLIPLSNVQIMAASGQLTTTNSSGIYSFYVDYGSSVTFYPYRDRFEFSPMSVTFDNIQGNKNQDFNALMIPQHNVLVSVTKDSLPLAGVTINCQIGSGAVVNAGTTLSNGEFTLTLNETTNNVVITPTKVDCDFVPPSRTLAGVNANASISFIATTKTFIITGNAGISGASITVTGDYYFTTTSLPDGSYTITGVPYGANIVITITKDGYNFTPASLPMSNIIQNENLGNAITPSIVTYLVTVLCESYLGGPVADVNVTITTSTGTTTAITGVDGKYVITANWSTEYAISVSKTGHIFDDNNPRQTGEVKANLTLTFTDRARISYSVSGFALTKDTLVPIQNVAIYDGTVIKATTNVAGQYSISVFEGDSVNLTANLFGLNFTPSALFITSVTRDYTQDFIAEVASHLVRGYVYKDGNPLAGVSVSINGGTPVLTVANGSFTLFANHGSNINVVPIYTGHYFAPTNHTINNLQGPVTDIIFNANLNRYQITGTVTMAGSSGYPVEAVLISDEVSEIFNLTDSAGKYTIFAYHGSKVKLVPKKSLHIFYPPSIEISNVTANTSNQDFISRAICAEVTFSVLSGTYYEPILLELYTTTVGADILYTFDEEENASFSEKYTAPILISNDTSIKIKAIAVKEYYEISEVSEASFRVTGIARKPEIKLPSGSYDEARYAQIVAPQNFNIYYTLNGNDPNHLDYRYDGPVLINYNSVLKAIAAKPDYLVKPDSVAVATYSFNHILELDLEPMIYLNRNTDITLDMSNHIIDSVEGNHLYSFTFTYDQDPPNVKVVEIIENVVRIIPKQNYHGKEVIGVTVEYASTPLQNPPTRETSKSVSGLLNITVHPDILPPEILGFFPLEDDVEFDVDKLYTFFVNVRSNSEFEVLWKIDYEEQDENDVLLNHVFTSRKDYQVKIELSNDSGFYWEKVWNLKPITITNGTDTTDNAKGNIIIGNYPNPFNPETKITYNLAEDNMVNLSVYNIRGQLVSELVNQRVSKGRHHVQWNASGQSSGIYFISLKSNEFHLIHKMVLLK